MIKGYTKHRDKWQVIIRDKYIGTFKTESDARIAYLKEYVEWLRNELAKRKTELREIKNGQSSI